MQPSPPRIALRAGLLAAAVAGLGLALRLTVPVVPVDAAFRDVLRAYGAAPSNTRETPSP